MQYSSMRRSGDRRTGMRAAMAVCALVAATAVVAATAPGVAAAPGDLQSSSFSLASDNDYAHGVWSDGTTMWVVDDDDDKLFAYNMPELFGLDSLGLDGIDFGTFTPGRLDYAANVPSATSYETLRDEILQVGNGTAVKFRRVDRRSDLWEIHVAPDSAAAVTLTIAAASDCTSTLYICTGGGKALSNAVSLVVPGPRSGD